MRCFLTQSSNILVENAGRDATLYLPSVLLVLFFLPLCLENFVQPLFQTRFSSDKLAIFLNASIFPSFLKDILTGHKTLSWVWCLTTALPGALMIEALSFKLFSFKLVMLCSLPVVHILEFLQFYLEVHFLFCIIFFLLLNPPIGFFLKKNLLLCFSVLSFLLHRSLSLSLPPPLSLLIEFYGVWARTQGLAHAK